VADPVYPTLPPNDDSDLFATAPEQPDIEHLFEMSDTKFSSSLSGAGKATTVKYSELPKLEGQNNYRTWTSAMKLVFRTMGCWDIVEAGATPAATASASESSAFETLQNNAATVMIQVVSSTILNQIVELEDPHKMWTYLKDQYYRDNSLLFEGYTEDGYDGEVA